MNPAYQGIWLKQEDRADALRHIYQLEPVIAFAAAVAATPLLLIVGVTISVLSGRAPLVRHTRVGFRGAPLPMLKFRTMWPTRARWGPPYLVEDVAASVPLQKDQDDERITSRFARFCRRFSIDELPQLYHVARGEMSFVGPRPITRDELDEHYGAAAPLVLSLRPGLTGAWQVLGRSRLTYAQRKRLDLWLVRSMSPALYFFLLWRSVPQVLHGHDAH